ncbi:MAG: hypothetical protein SFZ23_10070 [Planctomycetota bacterium]|nr:hypothetical protein [Planctomycetota bacterium]
MNVQSHFQRATRVLAVRNPAIYVLAWSVLLQSHVQAHDPEPAAERSSAAPATTSGGPTNAGPAEVSPVDWRESESHLRHHVQLTFREQFVKAGEAYFSPDARHVIFQAIQTPPAGGEPEAHYAMFVASLTLDGSGRVVGLGPALRLSPPGSANTCGWFHPTEPGRVLYASTLVPPAAEDRPGFQVGSNRYVWQFPQEMEIVEQRFRVSPDGSLEIASPPTALFERPRYDAEGSWSSDGRYVLYAHIEEARPAPGEQAFDQDANLYIFDAKTGAQHALVVAPGYDGGPFFAPESSPSAGMICYRSDRAGDDKLQLFVATLKRDAAGVPAGIEREYQLTSNDHVNWGPFWHPSGRFLVYATSEVGHRNYEVFAIDVDRAAMEKQAQGARHEARRWRVTHAPGADVLPVFSTDGRWMMWTSQRHGKAPGEERASSQLWLAEWVQAELMHKAPAR